MDKQTKELEKKEAEIIDVIQQLAPGFRDMINEAKLSGKPSILIHQDAFATDYQSEELNLLGSAIKYAGMSGINVQIIGVNRETLNQNKEDETQPESK